MSHKHNITIIEENFNPPVWARNCHVQSLLATIKFRRPLLLKQSKALLNTNKEMILDAGDGVQLQSFYSKHPQSKKSLAILIHGWEGSHESLYLLSAANRLYKEGHSVLRLNLRDHGTSHHLNEEIFHSNRLQEVINAVKTAQQLIAPKETVLIGFSLGGNFATRIANWATTNGIALKQTIAICPAINPIDILHKLETGLSFYHNYFIRKWKRSLRKKQFHFPESYNFDNVYPMKSMRQMTEYLLQLFGDYPTPDDYFNGYALSGDYLKNLDTPVTILMSKDDPVIGYQDTFSLAQTNNLKIHASQYGGHCGFIKNSRLQSWVDDFIVKTLNH